jgi:hypothetical protein
VVGFRLELGQADPDMHPLTQVLLVDEGSKGFVVGFSLSWVKLFPNAHTLTQVLLVDGETRVWW